MGQTPFLDDRRHLDLYAVFGEAELNPSRRFSLNIGGRIDWYDLYGNALSPRLAAMYFPTASTSLKYIFSHAFRAPDPYDEFYVDQVDLTSPGKSLTPENINSQMLLVDHAFNQRIHLSVSGFLNHLNQTIEEVQDATTGDTHFTNNRGDSGRGAEIEAIAKVPSGWSARTSYTIEQTHEIDDGTSVLNSPKHLAKFNGTGPVRKIGFLGTEFLYTSSQRNFLRQHVSSSFLVNTTFSTRSFWNGFQLSASCYNLLDRTWSTPTGPEVVQPATVQDGRTWRFRVTYRPSDNKKWPIK